MLFLRSDCKFFAINLKLILDLQIVQNIFVRNGLNDLYRP